MLSCHHLDPSELQGSNPLGLEAYSELDKHFEDTSMAKDFEEGGLQMESVEVRNTLSVEEADNIAIGNVAGGHRKMTASSPLSSLCSSS